MGRAGCAPRERHSRLSLRPRRPAGPASSPSSPGFLPRLSRAAACLGLAALLLAGAAGVAAPASAAVLVSNLGQGSDSFDAGTYDRALRFSTGSNAGGYLVTSVEVDTEDAQGDAFSVSICSVDGSGFPTSSCTALTAPSGFAAGVLEFTAPANTVLTASTTYAVKIVSTTSAQLNLDATTSGGEDAGGAMGWSIADKSSWRDPVDGWYHAQVTNTVARIGINGTLRSADNTAPTLSTAVIAAGAPKDVVLTFNEGLDLGSVPGASAFDVRVGGSARTVSDVGISGTKVTLTMGEAFVSGESVTVAYTKPGSNPLEDGAGNDVANITARSVTNNAPACPATGLPSSTFWKTCLTVGNSGADYGYASGYGALGSTQISFNNNQYTVSSIRFYVTDAVLVFEFPTAPGNVVDGWRLRVGDQDLDFSAATGTRRFIWSSPGFTWGGGNVGDKVTVSLRSPDTTAPTLSTSTRPAIASGAPKDLVLTFDEALAASTPAASAFDVRVGGTRRTVSEVDVSGAEVTLTMGEAFVSGESVTVAYTKPGSNPLKDAADNEVATFAAQTVTNNAPACPAATDPAGTFWSACLTVGRESNLGFLGFLGSTGDLSDKTFTHDGSNYAISGLLNVGLRRFTISFTSNPKPALNHWVLRIGDTDHAFSTSTTCSNTHTCTFTSTLNWTTANNVGDKVPVSLRLQDTTAPTLSTSVLPAIAATKPKELVLTFDEALAASEPAASAFDVQVDNSRRTVSEVDVSGAKVTLTMPVAFVSGESVTVAYTKPGSNPLEDAADNEVATFTAQDVTNNAPACPATGLPSGTFWSACLTVGNSGADYGYGSGYGALGSTQISLNNNQYDLRSIRFYATDAVLVFEFDTAPGNVVDDWRLRVGDQDLYFSAATGNRRFIWSSPGFTWGDGNVGDKVTVSLRPAVTAPTLSTATVMSNALKLQYDDALHHFSVPAPSDFTVTADGNPVAVSSVEVQGSRVLMKLASRILGGQDVRLGYTRGANPVKGLNGVAVAEFTDKALTNLTPRNDIVVSDGSGQLSDRHCWVVRCWEMSVTEGTEKTINVRLARQPSKTRYMGADGHGVGAVSVSPRVLTFTPQNWNVDQQVTVRGLIDDDSVDESVDLPNRELGDYASFSIGEWSHGGTERNGQTYGLGRLLRQAFVFVEVTDDNAAVTGDCSGQAKPANAHWVACLTVGQLATTAHGFQRTGNDAAGALNRSGFRTSRAHGDTWYGINNLWTNLSSNLTSIEFQGGPNNSQLSATARSQLTLHVRRTNGSLLALPLSGGGYNTEAGKNLHRFTWLSKSPGWASSHVGQSFTVALVDSSGSSVDLQLQPPHPPGTFEVMPGDGEATLTWTAPESAEGITGWQVRHGAADPSVAWGEWTDIEGATAETTTHTVTGLDNGTFYGFQVRAMAGTAEGEASDTFLAQPMAASGINPPTGLTASGATVSSVNLTWVLPGQYPGLPVTGVEVHRRTDGAWTAMATLAADATSYTATGLAAQTAYGFRVRLVTGFGHADSESVDATTAAHAVDPDGDGTRAGATALDVAAALQEPWYLRERALDRAGGDAVDYYRFTLTARNTLGLGIRGQSIDLDVHLEDADGNRIGSSWPPPVDATVEWLKTTLDAGTYYVRVEAAEDGATPYYVRFGLTETPAVDTDATRAGATGLDVAAALQSAWYLRDRALDRAAGDRVDYYRFTLAARKTLGLGVRGQSIDLDVHLENAQGARLASSWPPPVDARAEWLKTTLDAGTYYVRVEAMADGATSYYVRFGLTDPAAALSVADARAEEGTDAMLDFAVTLDRSATATVTVDYATADGTAAAGADYTATSGTLTFAAGERTKTVSVPVLDDAIDEGDETLTLRLTNPQGAALSDGEAVGTISNSDPLQEMWLARFGRTAATHVVDAVSDRLSAPLTGAEVTLGGQRVDLARTEDEAWLGETLTSLARAFGASEEPGPEGDGWPGTGLGARMSPAPDGSPARSMTGRELLLGSAFHLAGGGESGGPGYAAWGRVTTGGFDGEAPAERGDVRIDGEVTTGILGADAAWDRWLAGLAVSVSSAEGSFDQPGVDSGTVESSLTSVQPYVRLAMSERVSAWGLLGFGTGDMTITQAAREDRGEIVTRTDLGMRLGAIGARGALLRADEGGGIDLALKGDAFLVRMESEQASNTVATEADASRLRLTLEGSRAFALGEGAVLEPGLELGLRHDGGDAETGTGVELGGRIRYADTGSGLSVEASARTLIAHEASGFEEWGASGSVRLDPGASGRGLSFSLAPTLGAASSGTERLWSMADARGLAANETFEPEAVLNAELGYGLPVLGVFTGTPYAGLGLSESGRDWRLGWRLGTARRGGVDAALGLEGTRREPVNDDAEPEHGLMLRGALRW